MAKNTSSVEAECEENCLSLKRNLQTELNKDELNLKQANCKAHSKYLEYKFGTESMTVSRFIVLKRFFHFCFSHVDFHHLNFNHSIRTVSKSVKNVFYHYKLYPKQSVLI